MSQTSLTKKVDQNYNFMFSCFMNCSVLKLKHKKWIKIEIGIVIIHINTNEVKKRLGN